jgi:hypothetical protein
MLSIFVSKNADVSGQVTACNMLHLIFVVLGIV